MVYRFAPDGNQEDFAGGRVLYHRSGLPAFPVRLGNEIFRRCAAYGGQERGIRLYDPCCGGGYLLTVLGFLNAGVLGEVVGSDIDEQALALARDNLSLLSPSGRLCRRRQLEELAALYGKTAHSEALASLDRLDKRMEPPAGTPQTRTFCSDILKADALAGTPFAADVIFVDVPYGKLTVWADERNEGNAGTNTLDRMFRNLRPVRREDTVTAIVSDKAQKLQLSQHPGVYRLEKWMAGKRKVELFRG